MKLHEILEEPGTSTFSVAVMNSFSLKYYEKFAKRLDLYLISLGIWGLNAFRNADTTDFGINHGVVQFSNVPPFAVIYFLYLSHGMMVTSEAETYRAIPTKRPDFDAFLDSVEEFVGFASGVLASVQRVLGDAVARYMAAQVIVYLDGLMRGLYVGKEQEIPKFRKWVMDSYPQIRILVQ